MPEFEYATVNVLPTARADKFECTADFTGTVVQEHFGVATVTQEVHTYSTDNARIIFCGNLGEFFDYAEIPAGIGILTYARIDVKYIGYAS